MEIQLAEGPAAVASCLSWDKAIDRRIIYACLINGVYMLEADRQKKGAVPSPTPSWWRSFHYKLEELHKLMGKEQHAEEPHINLAVYTWDRSSRLLRPSKAPKVVVALRGTDLGIRSDLTHDWRVWQHLLHQTPRFHEVLRVVTSVVARYGVTKVCLCGHSLGAALVLIVARTFACSGSQIETHCFNPPFATLSFPDLWHDNVRKGLQLLRSAAAAGLSYLFKNPEQRKKDQEEFLALAAWHPHLYINAHDPVCCGYVDYFEGHAELAKSAVGALLSPLSAPYSAGGLLRTNAEPRHLIPSANLYVCEQGKTFMECHGLVQWWKPDLKVTSSCVSVVSPTTTR